MLNLFHLFWPLFAKVELRVFKELGPVVIIRQVVDSLSVLSRAFGIARPQHILFDQGNRAEVVLIAQWLFLIPVWVRLFLYTKK